MKKIKFALKNSVILALLISSFIACDKDFATVGSDIIGENDFGTEHQKYEVVAYTNKLEPIQTNNLPLNYLGAYKDPLYGLTTASFVSQVSSSLIDPDFGTNVELDSVVLTVPYFSTRVEVTSEGETIYALDSIFGEGYIDLSIWENNYFLNSIDPNQEFNTPLNYFSNGSTSNSAINSALLEGSPIPLESDVMPLTNMISNFKPSDKEIELWDANNDNEVTDRLAPSLRVKLDTEYWQEKIFDKEGEPELSNANNFNNYFRGIYFKATPRDENGSLALLNFAASNANITVYYTKDPFTDGAERAKSTYVLTFSGNRVNLLENDFNITIPQGDPVAGDEKLYLKGAQGANAVVDLFNSGTYEEGYSPEFIAFKNQFVETDVDGKFVKSKRLVNEANLVFYVDPTIVGEEPNRVYLYDLKNGTPLIDYYLDLANTTVPENSKINHLGILQREDDTPTGHGIKYKIKITEHINNLLLKDSTNIKLGLAVSGNVNLENTAPQFKLLTTEDALVKTIPVSAILSPKGTILYGNNTSDEEKKLYLEIYYTEPNN